MLRGLILRVCGTDASVARPNMNSPEVSTNEQFLYSAPLGRLDLGWIFADGRTKHMYEFGAASPGHSSEGLESKHPNELQAPWTPSAPISAQNR